ncbi:hypothetical protein Misp01_11400 [Microtetraspora sp. NBRC 13810]|uniref:Imm8 family immunity protein n=1 Tax=Microtetraspora sp. NBRC 13810 TaxID=3030990 RepID=UPI0024A24F3A|nr:Imm8 family immunity protein [Microtetraspora sp. NBRC 13810]GLW06010.1 hypothetical protein Misp01_11400 [Microtetraspora sp. NBRC 13810]
MRAELKGILSPDLDWESEFPSDPDNFEVFIQVFVGPAEGGGSESFDITIYSPLRISAIVSEHGIFDGRHSLIVARFDKDQIESYLRRRIDSLTANDWSSLAEKVARLGYWEFEDYEE